ncbi:HAD family phosphatase [Puniceibacterium sp. IMCC21224]|uniref:HAD family hydrolase n=1 Tax=Puniceibacterium sp. IMCC21224 TaxID=1618204 RepID=UPI00064DE70E|nr:HAD family phosphatase [Puniceibacterium sp. IMCC21224]KMK65600.1 haloacid dehalogenase superfamily protein, subfamily IA, variant 3 with third motif having DD or ED [Puniceibacterium sp. IMCC21224]
MTPQAVIFDIGNVLIEWQPERFFDRVLGVEQRNALFAEVNLHAMNDVVDRGADFRDTVYACAETYPAWRDAIRMWHDNWLDLATPEIAHSVRLLRALRVKAVPVFALTNFGIGTFALAEPRYPFLGEFDRRYISAQLGVIKPDPEIYAMVEADCGIAPQALLFTDDRADNIAAAKTRGWQAHLFEGPLGWAQVLVDQGLLTREEAA